MKEIFLNSKSLFVFTKLIFEYKCKIKFSYECRSRIVSLLQSYIMKMANTCQLNDEEMRPWPV